MPLFAHTDIPTITYRQFEFNVEYLDGKLELIPDDAPCCIMAHHPNKKFGYNVGILREVTANVGWEEVERLGHYNEDNPASVYYELVPKDKLYIYLEQPKFTVIDFKQEKPVVKKEEVKPNKIDLPSSGTKPVEPSTSLEQPKKTEVKAASIEPIVERKPRLVRDSEKAIYKYRSPGQRYNF